MEDAALQSGHVLVCWLARDGFEGIQKGGECGLDLVGLHVRMKVLGG